MNTESENNNNECVTLKTKLKDADVGILGHL